MNIQHPRHSDGNAYGRPAMHHDAELTEVAPGTPCGEFMRRYWQPIQLSSKVGTRPQKVRILGEDLILFRDGKGRCGLLTPRCAHRGTSLFYGRVDDNGIRCCYHGWQFDVEGRCIDQPCEPEGGLRKDRIRQPWYPVEERYGLVFAYMGPPAKKPVLPRWEVFENLAPGETIYVHAYTGYGVGADDTISIVPINWLQNYENIMDPFHVPMLHTRHSAVQYTPEAGNLPQVSFEHTELGMNYIAHRKTGDGASVERVTSTLMPNVVLVPDQQLNVSGLTRYIRWLVPVDDTSHVLFHAMCVPPGVDGAALFLKVSRPKPMGTDKMWSEMTDDEHQRFPTDWEAMVSQGPITLHSGEHLAMSDKGVAMLRRLLRQQIKLVQEGGDPIGVAFDADKAVNKVNSGNYFRPAPDKVPA
jgi:phenylpropionate dioxygenase-like ring-hydroxylating dioxygenase large terminal subunit